MFGQPYGPILDDHPELPTLLWADYAAVPEEDEEHWCISATGQLVPTFQEAQNMTGTVWLPLSRHLQKAAEIYVQLVCSCPAVSNEPQMLRVQNGWRIAVFFRELGSAQTIMFRKIGHNLLQVHEINKMTLKWTVPRPVMETMNRMSD